MALREVGFFRELEHGRPDGPSLADRAGTCADTAPLERYLRSGVHFIATAGSLTKDVLDPGRPPIGPLGLQTDGTWVWPSDLAHYVAVHGVDPGEAFRAHVARCGPVVGELDAALLGRLAEEEWTPECAPPAVGRARPARAVAALDALHGLTPAPAAAALRVDWAACSHELGVALPEDYVALVDDWGAGCFDDFLWLLAPGHPNHNLDLIAQAGRQLAALEELQRAAIQPPPFAPRIATGGLLPWAITDNGDVCCWRLTDVTDPGSWTVVVLESRGPEWFGFEGGVAGFLTGLLGGGVRVSVFPDEVPSPQPGFRRAGR
jgi:hypothetical protein